MPIFDQSVARHVGRRASKIWTPFSISLMMMFLDSSNKEFMLSSHLNGIPGFSSSRNGSILSAMSNAKDTWLIESEP